MKHKIYFHFATLSVVVLFALTAAISCTKGGPKGPKTIYQTISSEAEFSYLTAAIDKAGLVSALNESGKSGLTLFAPVNDAFIAAGFKTLSDLNALPDSTLKAILLYHVLGSKVEASQIPEASNTAVTTLNGSPIYATRTAAGNVFINGVKVITANIEATNGVIHAINRVLIPATGNIVKTAIGNPNLSLLVAAVLRASQGTTNVAAVLSSAGPFTVFAPTNKAFNNAGFANASAIQSADPNTLASILTYHVIAGRIFSSDLTDGLKPATLNGETVTITLTGGPKVKGKNNPSPVNIINTDIVASNGVVHIIDGVLLP